VTAIRPRLPAHVSLPQRAGSAVRACGRLAFNHDRKHRLTCADCLLYSHCLHCLIMIPPFAACRRKPVKGDHSPATPPQASRSRKR
jgi:hypothetical protein